jgi:mannose-1-phosphate guanylyltransferase/phosphomannomutase
LSDNVLAVVVAGGRGVRLGPATDHLPKPMLPVGDKPLLEHQLLWLRRFGVEEVVMCLGYKPEAVTNYFGDGSKWGMRISYQIESQPRGTAGCVADALPLLKGRDALVVYGDVFVDMDLSNLLSFNASHDGAATVVVFHSDHPFDSDLAKVDKTGRITGFFRPKQGDAFENLACAAVWIVRPELLALAPKDKPSDFGRDVFPEAVKKGLKLMSYKSGETLVDLGTPERRKSFLETWGRA